LAGKAAKTKNAKAKTAKAAKTAKTARKKRASSSEQVFQRIFAIVLAAMVVTVLLGLGPVWLSAEATRAAQHSAHLKEEITTTLHVSEDLEMRRVAITNDLRVNHQLMQDLGLVRGEGMRSYVELNSSTVVAVSQISMTVDPGIGSDSVAYLAALTTNDGLMHPGQDLAEAEQAHTQSSNFVQAAGNVLTTMAHLTAGEASTLLVGDVGIVGMR